MGIHKIQAKANNHMLLYYTNVVYFWQAIHHSTLSCTNSTIIVKSDIILYSSHNRLAVSTTHSESER